jgi:hypothetical protein
MSTTSDSEPELRFRDRAKAEKELEALAMEGLSSGEPIEPGPGYWEEKHRRLDERSGGAFVTMFHR